MSHVSPDHLTWFPGASGIPRDVKPSVPSLWLGATMMTSLSIQVSAPYDHLHTKLRSGSLLRSPYHSLPPLLK